MRLPFFNRVPVRKLTLETTGPAAAALVRGMEIVRQQLPDLRVLYLADNATGQVLGFYTTHASLDPAALATESARFYRQPTALAANDQVREVCFLLTEQLHFSCLHTTARWHWGIIVPHPDVSLALVRTVLRECVATP